MKKLVILFLVIGFIAFLYGCSNENSSLYITLDDISKNEHCSVNANGQLEKTLSFASGARLETTEDNTLAENVVVNVTETRSYDTGLNPIGKPEFIYVYGITAVLEDSRGNRTEVKSLKKPLTLTIPASHLGTAGICYAGVREDKSSPWKYTRLSESGVTVLSQRSIRAASSGSIRSSYEFSLYKMGIEIALFAYNKPPEEAQKDISGAGITAAPVTPLLTLDENGNYCDNLDMDIKLEGDNLSSLRDSDITVSIIYRSNKSTPEEIKINGMPPVNTETRSDAAVSGGNSYVHMLTLNKDNFKADFGGETSVKFSLDLKGKSSSDFPTDFIVEVNSADNIENLIPFTYSNNVSYKAEAVYSITYNLDGGILAEGDANPDRYTAASESFTLKNPVKEGYAFAGWTGTGLSSATMVVTIEKGSTGNREYKAVWIQNAPDTYTLTVLKGTGIATVSEGGNYEAGKEITLAYTLENGYEFTSWTSEDISADEAGKFTMPAKNVTVTANAGVITYRIAYEGIDGATFADGDNPETYDVTSATITLNNPAKGGYTFAGWTGTGLSSATMLVTIEKGSTGSREYKAVWIQNAPDTYTLTVLKGTGIATVSEGGNYEAGKEITLEYALENGYQFASWSSEDVSVDEAGKFTMPAKNVTVTANAGVITYRIAYEGIDGATFADGDNPETYDVASADITLKNPAKVGYDFLGWTGTGIEEVTASMTVTIPQGSTGDRTYTAIWSETPSTITLDSQGGNLSACTWVVDNKIIYTSASGTFNLPEPVKEYYDFVGWIYGENAPVKVVEISAVEDRTYVASWTPTIFTITYEGTEGATFADGDNPSTYNVESADITLKNPAKAGYTFRGWSGTDLTGDENQTVTIAQGSTGDKTYTANWTPVIYAISYDLTGGALAEGVTNPESYDITSATITLSNPVRGGYDFLGWTGTGIEEGTASMTVTIPQGSMGDRNYVASWTLAVITFTLPGDVELEMRPCRAGSFVRSGRDGYGDGNTVTITKDFYMGTYKVTNAQYAAIMGSSPSSGAGADFTGDKQPVVYVSWNDIMTDSTGFISKLNAKLTETGQQPSGYKFALPTEAQWEYACRAGTTTDLNSNKNIVNDWDNDPYTNEVARNYYNSDSKTHDVGGLASNSFGLYDMHGNVYEWCADWYGDYSSTDLTDPTGPAEPDPSYGSNRVVRGGSWISEPFYCTSWFRNYGDPDYRDFDCGFRLALVPVPIPE